MDICISSGHGLRVRGAKGVLDEVDEARRVVDRVATLLQAHGVGAHVYHDNTSTNVSANLNAIVQAHNSRSRDRDISVHFNAFQTTSKAMGCEVLYVSNAGKAIADKVVPALAKAGGFINRGAKKRTDLRFLNSTAKPSALLEICFVDSTEDARLYRENFEGICRALAESIGDIRIGTPPPVEPPAPPPVEPEGPTDDNIVDIAIETRGDPTVTINGDLVNAGNPNNRLDIAMAHQGDVIVTVDGEDFQIETSQPWIDDIIATVFGGAADPNNSAYPPFDKITDTELSVALPYKFTGPRPRVEVRNRVTDKTVTCEIRDVGPWLTDDNFFDMGWRPLAEVCWRNQMTLPRGPNKGTMPNGGGIDLTPAAARAIGIAGKGLVDFRFTE